MALELEENTINHFHNWAVHQYRERPFLFYVGDTPMTYKQYGDEVRSLRLKLCKAGFKKGDSIALLANGSPHWAISFMAIMSAGLVVVPIMDEFLDKDISHILENSEAMGLIIDPLIFAKRDIHLKEGTCIISIVDFQIQQSLKIENSGVYKEFLSDVSQRNLPFDSHGVFPSSSDDIAELLYTSGTTGHSKAVKLSHNNLVTNLVEGTDLIDDCFDQNSVLLSLLPVAHSFGSTSAFLSTMYKGPKICFLKRKPSPEYLQRVFSEVHPTILGGVPLIFEKIYQKKIKPELSKHPILEKFVFRFPFLRKGFHRFVGKKILNYFGGSLRCIIIGGATFSNEVETFMREAKIPYVLGYGLSETSPLLTFSSLQDSRFGSVGYGVRNTKIRITDQDHAGVGSIEVKGPQVMKGYFKLPKETKAVFTSDGWFKTGDRGILDKDNFLFIKGRSKNVIVNNSGENIYPEVIEVLLGAEQGVEDALVYQESGLLKGLIYFDKSVLKENKEEFLDNLKKRVNRHLNRSSQISYLEEQKTPFVKTPTKKIKRGLYIKEYL